MRKKHFSLFGLIGSAFKIYLICLKCSTKNKNILFINIFNVVCHVLNVDKAINSANCNI